MNIAFIIVIAGLLLFFHWLTSLKPLYMILIIFFITMMIINISTYISCEKDRKHIKACKKKGIKPTILHTM